MKHSTWKTIAASSLGLAAGTIISAAATHYAYPGALPEISSTGATLPAIIALGASMLALFFCMKPASINDGSDADSQDESDRARLAPDAEPHKATADADAGSETHIFRIGNDGKADDNDANDAGGESERVVTCYEKPYVVEATGASKPGMTLFSSQYVASVILDVPVPLLDEAIDGSDDARTKIRERIGDDAFAVVQHDVPALPVADASIWYDAAGTDRANPASTVVLETDAGFAFAFRDWESVGAWFGVKADTAEGWHRDGRIPDRHGMRRFIAVP